jgi:RNA-binding protein with serine-rich domain 1
MPSRSPSRGRGRSRSPYSDMSVDPRPESRTPSRARRTISPRSSSRTPRRNGRYRSESRSVSRGRSASPIRSTKVCPLIHCNDLANNSQVVVEKLTKNVTEAHLKEIFGTYGSIVDLDMPLNRACKFSIYFCRFQYNLTSQSKPIEAQPTFSTVPRQTLKQPLHTCTNPKSTAP